MTKKKTKLNARAATHDLDDDKCANFSLSLMFDGWDDDDDELDGGYSSSAKKYI